MKDQEINTYQGYGSMPDQSEEWEEKFDTEFPEVLKFLPDNEDNTYKFLFQKQNKELKRFISQEIQLAYDCGFKEGVDDLFFSCAGDEDCVDTLNYLRELRK